MDINKEKQTKEQMLLDAYNKIVSHKLLTKTIDREWSNKKDAFKKLTIYDPRYSPSKSSTSTSSIK